MNILAHTAFSSDGGNAVDIIKHLGPSRASSDSFENPVIGIPWQMLEDRVEWPVGFDYDTIRNDAELSYFLDLAFLTVVYRLQWKERTANAQQVELESLEYDEIFFRARSLDHDRLLLIPDDRLKAPSLMLQCMIFPSRVGVLR